MTTASIRQFASVSDTCRRIWLHPENQRRRLKTIGIYFAWQVWERTVKRPWTITLAPGRRIRCYPHCAVSSGTLYYRLPERSSMRFLLDYLQPGDTFVDVGANVATYSLLASTVEGVQSVAFEPSSITHGRAVRNIALNEMEDRVRVQRQAVGAESGTVRLSIGLGPCNRVVQSPSPSAVPATSRPSDYEEVPMVSLDEVLVAGSQFVSLVKIDVEGGEIAVLSGARALIARDGPALIVEVNDPVELNRLLTEFGYTCWTYDPDLSLLAPTSAADHLGRNVIALREIGAAAARINQKVNHVGETREDVRLGSPPH